MLLLLFYHVEAMSLFIGFVFIVEHGLFGVKEEFAHARWPVAMLENVQPAEVLLPSFGSRFPIDA